MADIAESICVAVDQIVKKRLEAINYDSTIKCIVMSVDVDESESPTGKYIVTDGAATFAAYSKDTSYKEDDVVYVTIPNNDQNNQKIIIGKYKADDQEPYAYKHPFDGILDTSNNLIPDFGEMGLIANHPTITSIVPSNNGSWDFSDNQLAGYTRLGVKAGFKSWLKNLNAVTGDYGLKITLYCEQDLTISARKMFNEIAGEAELLDALKVADSIEDEAERLAARSAIIVGNYQDLNNSSQNEYLGKVKIFITTHIDTSGNITYSFDDVKCRAYILTSLEPYFNQSIKLENAADPDHPITPTAQTFFDLTLEQQLKYLTYCLNINAQVESWELYLTSKDMYGDPYNYQTFYQQEKVFDISGIDRITKIDVEFYQTPGTFFDANNNPLKYNVPSANLFVNDLYLCVGYDMSTFDSEAAYIYTLDGGTYSKDETSNDKQIQLRWIHTFDDGQRAVVTPNSTFNDIVPEIRWYKYQLGAAAADSYSGVYWQRTNLERRRIVHNAVKQLSDIGNVFYLQYHKDGNTSVNETAYNSTFLTSAYNCLYNYGLSDPSCVRYWNQLYPDVQYAVTIENNEAHVYSSMSTEGEYTTCEISSSDNKFLYNGKYYSAKNGDGSNITSIVISYKNLLNYYHLNNLKDTAFLFKSYKMSSITKLDDQSWEDLFLSQMVYHNAGWSYSDKYIETDIKHRNLGCLHRVGFWELFTVAYKFYWVYPSVFDGFFTNPEAKDLQHCGIASVTNPFKSVDGWEYSGLNPYEDLTYQSNTIRTDGVGTKFKLRDNTPIVNQLLTSFANAHADHWVYVTDAYGMKDYRPAKLDAESDTYIEDTELYTQLYNATRFLFYKIDHADYQIITEPDNFSYEMSPDDTLQDERVKVIILAYPKDETTGKAVENATPTVIRSNVLTLLNEDEVINSATSTYVSGLNLWCDDNSYGNYLIYGLNNKLLEQQDQNVIRDIDAHFDTKTYNLSAGEADATILTSASSIIWSIPFSNSMIRVRGVDYNARTNEDLNQFYKLVYTDSATIKFADGDTSRVEITRLGAANNDLTINPTLEYTIQSTYSAAKSSNTIQCTVIKDNINYVTSKEFTFGQAGTSGTDSTLVIDFDYNQWALNADLSQTEQTQISLTAHLYDAQGKEYDTNNQTGRTAPSYSWTWADESLNTTNNVGLINATEKRVSIQYTPSALAALMNNIKCATLPFLILQCTISGWGDYDLIAYKAIPIRYIKQATGSGLIKDIHYLNGDTTIVYLSDGTANYYKNPYQILPNTATTFGIWNPHNEPSNFIGAISSKNILQPVSTYMSNTHTYGLIAYIGDQPVWAQPIVILQNRYPSETLNKWNGKDIQINEDNGSIIAPMMAAGKKNTDNTFSGVMLGDWSTENVDQSMTQQTGVYGFNHGAMSYAFKEDGTAFIGKAGGGRIEFDGNNGTIQSASYNASNVGMCIDLDDGYIDIRGATSSANNEAYLLLNNGHTATINADGTVEYPEDYIADGTETYISSKKQFVPSGARIQINVDGTDSIKPYFAITSKNGNNLLNISENSYYLKTDNWQEFNSTSTIHTFTMDVDNSTVCIDGDTDNLISYGVTPQGQAFTYNGITVVLTMAQFMAQGGSFTETTYTPGKGTYFDLQSGKLTGYNFALKALNNTGTSGIILSSSGTQTSPYLKIMDNGSAMLLATSNHFYLQSPDYNTTNQTGLKLDLKNSTLNAYNFSLYAASGKNSITLSSSGSPFFAIKADNSYIFYASTTSYYLQSANYSNDNKTGINFNLSSGKLTGYNFNLTASSTSGTICIDSDAATYPLWIGSAVSTAPFKVNWNGSIEINPTDSATSCLSGWYFGKNPEAVPFNVDCIYAKNATGHVTLTLLSKDQAVSTTINNTTKQDWVLMVDRNIQGVAKFGITMSGEIYASAGNIAGWTINEKSFFTGTNDEKNIPTLYFGTDNLKRTLSDERDSFTILGETNKVDWRLKIANSFGVDSTGKLFANDAEITGRIHATGGQFDTGCVLGPSLYITALKRTLDSNQSTTQLADTVLCSGPVQRMIARNNNEVVKINSKPSADSTGLYIMDLDEGAAAAISVRGEEKLTIMNSDHFEALYQATDSEKLDKSVTMSYNSITFYIANATNGTKSHALNMHNNGYIYSTGIWKINKLCVSYGDKKPSGTAEDGQVYFQIID